jgi:DNA-binding response OmpR family regulator
MTLSLDDIRAAADRLKGHIERTPRRHSRTLSEITGAEVWVKFENLQFTAAFKERGALNKLALMSADERARGVTVDGKRVALTGKEYAILEMLSLRKGMTLTKEMFLTHLYGGRDEPELKIIDVFICKLRKKLAAATGGEHNIETVWGRGYVLRDPQDMGAVAAA